MEEKTPATIESGVTRWCDRYEAKERKSVAMSAEERVEALWFSF